MQSALWGALARRAQAAHGKLPASQEETDFGLYHDMNTALEVWSVWDEHGTLPGAGGWLDQDEFWRRDLLTIDALYAQAWIETKPPGGGFQGFDEPGR